MDELARLRKIQSEVETRNQSKIARMIETAMNDAVARWRVTGNPNPPEDLKSNVMAALIGIYTDVARVVGGEVIEQFKECYPTIETKQDEEDLFDRIVQDFIARYGARAVVNITSSTREHMIKLISKGQKEGLGVDAIARSIREKIPEISALRAHVIARTETHSASMFASQEVAKTSSFPLVKRWVSASDHRTRDFGESDGVVDAFNHRSINGQTVALNARFAVPMKNGGTEYLDFVGDPNGSAGNVIMCRCAQVYRRVET